MSAVSLSVLSNIHKATYSNKTAQSALSCFSRVLKSSAQQDTAIWRCNCCLAACQSLRKLPTARYSNVSKPFRSACEDIYNFLPRFCTARCRRVAAAFLEEICHKSKNQNTPDPDPHTCELTTKRYDLCITRKSVA